MELKIILEQGDDGMIVAHCPSLKSCWSQGRTREEALPNIREAIELYLVPSEGLGDLFLKIFGPDRGVDLELSERQPHKPVQIDS